MKLAASDGESVAPLASGMGRVTFHAEVWQANTSRMAKSIGPGYVTGRNAASAAAPRNGDACNVQLCCSRKRLPHHIVWL